MTEAQSERRGQSALPALLRHFRPAWSRIGLIGLTSTLCALLETGSLLAFIGIADALVSRRESFQGRVGPLSFELTVPELLASALALILSSLMFQFANAVQQTRLVCRWEAEERYGLVRDFLRSSWPTKAAHQAAELHELSAHTVRVAAALGQITVLIRAAMSVTILLLAALAIDYRGTLAVACVGAALSFVLRPLTWRFRAAQRKLIQTATAYSIGLAESRRVGRDLHAFGVLSRVEGVFTGLIEDHVAQRTRVSLLEGAKRPLYQHGALLFMLAGVAVVYSIRLESVEALGAVVLIVLRSLTYGQQLQGTTFVLSSALPYLESLATARARLRADVRKTGGDDVGKIKVLGLESVGFSYVAGERALKDVSVRFVAGEVVGVIGPSGSGKTTLAQLILRLRTPTEGVLTANDVPAARFSLDSWAREVAWVPQAPTLLHGTVLENIRFYREVSDERVRDAAKAARIHDVIEALPLGYETQVGESTRDLSGGQIQRIAIARALAADPSFIVLDEATSALDTTLESLVQESLQSLRGRVSMIVIAHRLATLRVCDRVIMFSEGRLVRDGSLSVIAEHQHELREALGPGLDATDDSATSCASSVAPGDALTAPEV